LTASSLVIVTQFFVHFTAYWQVRQWYLWDWVLKTTLSSSPARTEETPAVRLTMSNRPITTPNVLFFRIMARVLPLT